MPSMFELVRVSPAEYGTGSGGGGFETFVAVAEAGQCVESLQAIAITDPTAGKLNTFRSTPIELGRMTKRTTQPPGGLALAEELDREAGSRPYHVPVAARKRTGGQVAGPAARLTE
jgi:hypothetical protein